jgi:hypothetical protein
MAASPAPASADNGCGLAITLDVDWAPDHVIDAVAARLIDARVRATWFVTHASSAVNRLRRHDDLFELGIHPNFMPGSSHGSTVAEVVSHCMQVVPEARVMRTHGLVQSSRLFSEIMSLTTIRIDSSLMLRMHPGLQVVRQPFAGGVLTRLPVWWEDDIEQVAPDPRWSVTEQASPGLRILNFHPVHVMLNGSTPAPYTALKHEWPALCDAPAHAFSALGRDGPGPASAFGSAITVLAASGGGVTLSRLAGHGTAALRDAPA